MKDLKLPIQLWALLFFFSLATFTVRSQDVQLPIPDSAQQVETIELSEISRKSAEITLLAKEIARKIISDEKLENISHFNDSLISMMDSLMLVSDENVSNKNWSAKQNCCCRR